MEELQENIPVAPKKKKLRAGLSFWLFIALSLGSIVLFVFAMEWRESLKIERVVVEGARVLAAKEIVALAAIDPGTPVYAVNLYEIRQRLLTQAMIKHALVSRQLRDALRITIVEREPVAALTAARFCYVDDDGVLLPRIESAVSFDLPVITGIDGLDTAEIGKRVALTEVHQAIAILRMVQEVGFTRSVSEINMNAGGDISLISSDSGVPILLGRGMFEKKLSMLQTFWSSFIKADDVARLQYVDVRFEGQVVVKWHQQKKGALATRL